MKDPLVKKLVLAIGTLSVALFVIYAEFWLINRFNLRSAEYASIVAQAMAEHSSAADLIEKLSTVGGSHALTQSAMVTKEDLVPFIESLETAARARHLLPEVTAAQEGVNESGRSIITATFDVEGKRSDVDLFLEDLDGLKYHIAVAGIRLTQTDGGKWRATLAVQAYGLPNEQ